MSLGLWMKARAEDRFPAVELETEAFVLSAASPDAAAVLVTNAGRLRRGRHGEQAGTSW